MVSLVCLFIIPFISMGDAYKILVYSPKFGHSHINFMGSIADTLAEEGHNVTTLMPVLAPNMRNGTVKTRIIYILASEETRRTYDEMWNHHSQLFQSSIYNAYHAFIEGRGFGTMFTQTCRETIETEGLLNELRDEHFDVMLTENFDMCGMAMSHFISPKATCLVSTSVFFGEQKEELGVPPLLSFNPSMYTSSLDVNSLISRAWNVYAEFLVKMVYGPVREMTNALFKEKYGSDYPSIYELTSRVAYAFTNSEPLIDFATPTLSKVVEIGGLGARKPKTLHQHWKDLLSLRPRSVLISFGSIAHSSKLPEQCKMSILKMAKSFPNVTFIWKYEDNDDEFATITATKVDNVVLSKWTPQNELLNDERMAAFISHAGMGSLQEAVTRGVPVLFIPVFGEQPRNAAMMEYNGIGKVLEKQDLSDSSKLITAVGRLLNDRSIIGRAKHISRMLKNKPFSSREKLIKHVEFAAEFGPSDALRPQSHEMSIMEYFNLDIFVLIAFVIASFFILALIVLKTIAASFIVLKRMEKCA